MDFGIVKGQIISEYVRCYGSDRRDHPWSLENCINVFRCFYKTYKRYRRTDHPHLTNKTIRDIILRFPYLAADGDTVIDGADLFPKDYVDTLIPKYFEQYFPNCDYSIVHFMSGQIRTIRYFENLY